jgi:hypothetical protein
VKAKAGRVAGIYVAEVTVPSAGMYDIEFHVKKPELDERMPPTDFKVGWEPGGELSLTTHRHTSTRGRARGSRPRAGARGAES